MICRRPGSYSGFADSDTPEWAPNPVTARAEDDPGTAADLYAAGRQGDLRRIAPRIS